MSDGDTTHSAAPRFSVIIVNYNAGSYLRRAVEALLLQDGPEFEALLVDNGSTDGSLDGLPMDPRLTVIEAGENLGFAAANNLAARRARGEWVVTLNPDAFARPGWLAALERGTRRNPGVAMFGSMQVMAEQPDLWDGAGDELSIYGIAYRAGYGKPRRTVTADYPVFGPCAAAAAYRRDVFEAAGGFDERFFCYHEDVDLALRLRAGGHRAMQVHDAVVDHVGGGTAEDAGGGGASDFAVYHGTRNRVWTWVGSMPLGMMIGLLPLFVGANLAYLGWSVVRQARLGPTARGLWHGLRGAPGMVRTRGQGIPDGRRSTVAGMLVWSPRAVIGRRNKVGR